jgi:hypothetical protein
LTHWRKLPIFNYYLSVLSYNSKLSHIETNKQTRNHLSSFPWRRIQNKHGYVINGSFLREYCEIYNHLRYKSNLQYQGAKKFQIIHTHTYIHAHLYICIHIHNLAISIQLKITVFPYVYSAYVLYAKLYAYFFLQYATTCLFCVIQHKILYFPLNGELFYHKNAH